MPVPPLSGSGLEFAPLCEPRIQLHQWAPTQSYSWLSNGWIMLSPVPAIRTTSHHWVAFVTLTLGDEELWHPIRGGMEEIDLRQYSVDLPLKREDLQAIRSRFMPICIEEQRKALHALGIDTEQLVCSDFALMRAKPGVGLQPVHMDMPDYAEATECYSVLTYCNDNDSTALPRLPLSELRDTFTQDERSPSQQACDKIRPDSTKAFLSVKVEPGVTSIFRTDLPHFGVQNKRDTSRILTFALWGPKAKPPLCVVQRYPHGAPP